MRGFLSLALIALAVGFDLSNKDYIWGDGLSDHISLAAVTPKPSGFTVHPSDLSSCSGWDSCDTDGQSPYYPNDGLPVNSTWLINFDDGTWTELCICEGYVMDENEMAKTLSYVPPSVRSSVNRVTQKPTGNGAVTLGNSAIYFGRYNVEVFVHESSHSFDWSNEISGKQEWLDAIGNDTCVPDPYASSNEAEDWAQTSVLYWFLTYSNANNETLHNATFECWSRSREVAASYMPNNTSREFDPTHRVTIMPKTSSGSLNYLDNGEVSIDSPHSSGWQLVTASYNYYIICESGDFTLSCLDALGQNQENDPIYMYYPRNGGVNQQWSLLPDGEGYYKIINRANGMALTTYGCGTGNATASVVFGADGDQDCNKWKIIDPNASTTSQDDTTTTEVDTSTTSQVTSSTTSQATSSTTSQITSSTTSQVASSTTSDTSATVVDTQSSTDSSTSEVTSVSQPDTSAIVSTVPASQASHLHLAVGSLFCLVIMAAF
ncbi:hypothetical protein PROFUN_09876 [Planoprotostelium fungivorum]|uniref:Ricin B lectin domain-containing protein n=1 Tax=Planoprotostelium fungivorum TaxID=1890364 RepID=A0A2P6NGF6_9EUKA|nr:hypothetical protein PROFUN_09876 [Planoprotostelium fungivorum]